MSNNVEFKPTEIGSIPNDWHTTELKDVLTIGHGKPQFAIENENGKYPILATGGILGYTNHYLYNKPSVLIGRKGTIDKPQYMDTPFWTVDTLFYTHINEKFNPKFIYYKFHLIDWKRRSEASGVPSLSSSIINEQIISHPQLPEQQKIAQALTDADNYISALEKLIEKKKMMKEGLMVNLLTGKQRLKEFAFNEDGTEKGYKESELGKIPEDWEIISLPDILISNGIKIGPFGSQLKKEFLCDSGFKVYGQENVFINNFEVGNRYINYLHFSNLQSCEIKCNDFLISMMGTIGKVAIVPKGIQRGIMDSHLIRLRVNQNIYDIEFLKYIFTSELIKKQISKLTVGGIMDGLSSKTIKSLFLYLPPLEEQTCLTKYLNVIDDELDSLSKKLGKAQNLKNGMMQKLLTGEIRLA